MSSSDDVITVKVKSLRHPQATELRLRKNQTVLEVKRAVGELLEAGDNYVRLIASGRMLAPDSALVEQFCPPLQDGSYLHAAVTAKPSPGLLQRAAAAAAARPPPGDEEDLDPASLRGFDRLRLRDFGRAEVLALRSYFRRQLREHGEQLGGRGDGESAREFQHRVEEHWVGPDPEPPDPNRDP
eukprot:CAMPEP_0118884046 /NCGR_PEP_ID=MMETSP1163-20130328/22983_1 /TAXON_ID=124430 /ORGANISM="Phaeomonas parva, Strain CCMP2877" /LENGTH=183 /DNA_ID=CAMNT_0006821685 /DNA_START=217 /DNA_END=768 /DNA_ORIENTATION=-